MKYATSLVAAESQSWTHGNNGDMSKHGMLQQCIYIWLQVVVTKNYRYLNFSRVDVSPSLWVTETLDCHFSVIVTSPCYSCREEYYIFTMTVFPVTISFILGTSQRRLNGGSGHMIRSSRWCQVTVMTAQWYVSVLWLYSLFNRGLSVIDSQSIKSLLPYSILSSVLFSYTAHNSCLIALEM